MKKIQYKPKSNSQVQRNYTILECKWSDFSEIEKKYILKEAEILCLGANSTGANTGISRSNEKKYIDSLSGTMAEFAVTKFLNMGLGLEAKRPTVTTTHNQVDISFQYNQKTYTVEVRSSFVQNGIDFALYGFNKNTNKTFFDVLGPYKQENHKTDFESVKDLFMRVLFDIKDQSKDGFDKDKDFYTDKEHFIKKYITDDKPFYIIGGLSGNTIMKENYIKQLTPRDLTQYPAGITPGEYYVAQISNIADIDQLLEYRKNQYL